jgi:hypothetical protein
MQYRNRNEDLVFVRAVQWRVEADGLYQADKDGRLRKIASRGEAATVTYFDGRLMIRVSQNPVPNSDGRHRLLWPGPRMMSECVNLFRSKLADRREVVDLDRGDRPSSLSRPGGFKLRVRGLGIVFLIEPDCLRRWIPGAMPIGTLLAELDRRGWLIRGADGGTTRQVVIPGHGRIRFYCLKLAAGGDDRMDQDLPGRGPAGPGGYGGGAGRPSGPEDSGKGCPTDDWSADWE